MNTVQDNPITKSKCNLGSKCIVQRPGEVRRSFEFLKYAPVKAPVRNRTINLLEHDDLVARAGELINLQDQIHRARKKNYDLQTLTQQETRYAAMKQEFDSTVKKASEEQYYGPKTNTTA